MNFHPPLRRLAGAALLVLGACGGGGAERAAGRPPDVVVVLIDTLRADRLSCYGYGRPTSPWLDELARGGTRFADVTAQASWTQPSMVSILQGRYVTAYRDQLDPEHPSLPEVFRRAGYRTIGLVANLNVSDKGGFHRGFQLFDRRPVRSDEGWREWRPRTVEELEPLLWRHVERLAEADEEGTERPPHFFYLHLIDPHAPYDPVPELDATIPPVGPGEPMPWDWQARAFEAASALAPPAGGWAARWAAINRERGLYDQGIRASDAGLERIFAGLRERGFLEDTLVAVLSDHGECLWERRSLASAGRDDLGPEEFFYDGHGALLSRDQVATPLILQGTGVPAGRVVEEPVENVDLFPTLLELCDLPSPGELHGRSLVPLMAGGNLEREAVYSFTHRAIAVRELETGWKLVSPLADAPSKYTVEPQLYHLPTDPDERANVHADHPDVVARLTARIDSWRAAHPTRSNFGRTLSAEEEQNLRDLGYTDQDTGR